MSSSPQCLYVNKEKNPTIDEEEEGTSFVGHSPGDQGLPCACRAVQQDPSGGLRENTRQRYEWMLFPHVDILIQMKKPITSLQLWHCFIFTSENVCSRVTVTACENV